MENERNGQRVFQVGDLVRIRNWDDMVAEYGTDVDGDIPIGDSSYFVRGMKHLCGEEFTIDGFDEDPLFPGDVWLSGEYDGFTLNTQMLELVESVDAIPEEDHVKFEKEYMSVLLGNPA